MNEVELVRNATNGDERAFELLAAPYRRELKAHCYRMLGSPHDAEDAVQETLIPRVACLSIGKPERSTAMRKLIVTNIVSLDGYYEGPGNNVMALPMDEAFDAYNLERLRSADTLLVGRATYEGFKSFWPPLADDPEAVTTFRDKPEAQHVLREISRRDNEIEKLVVSDTLTPEETAPWTDTTRIVRRADAHKEIAELKQQDGGDIVVIGSRTLWNDLLAAGLVDEIHLMVGAVALGDGTPAFGQETPPLRLIDVRTFGDSDNHVVRYTVGR